MTNKKLVELVIIEKFKGREERDLALKLVRSSGKKEMRRVLDSYIDGD